MWSHLLALQCGERYKPVRGTPLPSATPYLRSLIFDKRPRIAVTSSLTNPYELTDCRARGGRYCTE
jgi:hypothetical protein